MNLRLTKAMRSTLEETIDHAISKKLRLRGDAEDRLGRVQNEDVIATADLVALFRAVIDIQSAADSIAADRYNLLRF
jgi:hypothetical protein